MFKKKSPSDHPPLSADQRFAINLDGTRFLSGFHLMRSIIWRCLTHPLQYFAALLLCAILNLLSLIPWLGMVLLPAGFYVLAQYLTASNFANCFKPLGISLSDRSAIEYTFSLGIFIVFIALFFSIAYGQTWIFSQSVPLLKDQQFAQGFGLYALGSFLSTLNVVIIMLAFMPLLYLRQQPTFFQYIKNIFEFLLSNALFIITAMVAIGLTSVILFAVFGFIFQYGVALVGFENSVKVLTILVFTLLFPIFIVFFSLCGHKLEKQLYSKTLAQESSKS